MSGQRGSIVRVLKNPALRRIQLAFLGSTLGDWAYGVAVTVWAYSEGGAAAVGVYLALRFVVAAVAGPLGAALADKVGSRKRYMMANDGTRAVLVATAAVVVGTDGPAVLVFGLALLAAGVGASFRAAQSGLVPRLVDDPAELTATNAVTSNLETVAMFSGPAIGALLLAVVDVQAVFWLNALTFVWSLSLVAAVRVPPALEPAHDEDEQQDGFLREITAGFAQLGRDRDLRTVSLVAASQGVIWGSLTVFMVIIAVETLDAGAAGVGYLNTVMGLGTVAGGLAVLGLVGRGRLGRDMAYGVLGWAVPLLVMALFPSPVVAVAALAVIGLSDPWVNLGLDTIPQRVAPARIVSRVFAAVDSALIAAMALGAATAPLLVHLLGLRGAMAALGLLVVVIAVASLPRMRRLDARLAEPEHTALLRGIDVFAPLPPAAVESLAGKLQPTPYAAGATVMATGDHADGFFVILSGRVEVTRDGALLRTEGPGEYVGEIGLLRDVPRTATVTATEDTVLLRLDRTDFLTAVTGTPAATRAADAVVADRLAV
ncbi:MFS transporter [Nocardioides sp. URHA0032]|uniref:MFS transporter n=1 Tax=Nocardioides sp. URHA0032 TaxID=1380388 RepID=UPI000490B95B|nr:MFS transporter [Nocardioides sp. URHA0032]